jgi:hypothetical protein
MAQREIHTTATADISPNTPTQSPITQNTATTAIEPTQPINAKPAATTAVSPTTPTATPTTVQRSTQIQKEIIADSAAFAPNTSAPEITETTAVPQPTTTNATTTVHTKPATTNTAVPSSPTPSHQTTQPDVAQAIATAKAPTNGRLMQRQTEGRTATPELAGLTNLPALTEQIQRVIATNQTAPVIKAHQTSQQSDTNLSNGPTQQNRVVKAEPATGNHTPSIQRAEAETAVAPEPPLIAPEPPATNNQPLNTEQSETAAEPDIDALARQVYSDLKRRLSVEWERNRGRIIT